MCTDTLSDLRNLQSAVGRSVWHANSDIRIATLEGSGPQHSLLYI